MNLSAIGTFEDVPVSYDPIDINEEAAAARQFLATRVESLDRDCGWFDAANEFREKILRCLDGWGNQQE